ncbi:MAG: aminopeptidase [Saccharofermentanales bacterium]|jgi:aspartyl aminopeptidase|nr:aminopeptidase [Clostridiaceae bacterium]
MSKNEKSDKVIKEQPADQSQAGKALKKKLQAEFPNLWDVADPADRDAAFSFAEEYKNFLNSAKTEREFVTVAIEKLESMGFSNLDQTASLAAGDKIFKNIRGKGLVAAVIGDQPIETGCNLIGAHIDSPRLDLKPNPVYEDADLTFLKTHYYGGIKKYQWPAIPLALHGVVFRADGSPLVLNIGESDQDPVLTITDLLPHLGAEQMSRKSTELIKGEELNVLAGGLPYPDPELAGRFKLHLLQLLNERYGLVEKDLITAEIEIVPAGKARDVGLDRSMIGAYGQDDRVCAFPALAALSDLNKPERTSVCMFFDKEETGSDGNTGAQSRSYENVLLQLLYLQKPDANMMEQAKMMENCQMLSADVSNAFDPTFSSVSDPRNNSYLGRGISLVKYTGSRGKGGTSDANAEFFARIVRLFDAEKIPWQTGELGKVDAGGGGTIAKYLANTGMDVIDCGIPVLSMHSPFEISSKIDLYFTYLAYKTFLAKM